MKHENQSKTSGPRSLQDVGRPEGNRERQIWDAATIATEKYPEIAWRYELQEVRLGWRAATLKWLNGLKNLEWNWSRTGLVMRPIKPGEPGYDRAPYEMGVVWHRDVKGPTDPDQRPGEQPKA